MPQASVDRALRMIDDKFLAQRLRPTVERVRLQIGRGSPNTVAPMLEAWFAGLAPRLGVAPAAEAGQLAPPPAVRQALDAVWATALAAATELAGLAVAQERETLSSERQDVAHAREALARHSAKHCCKSQSPRRAHSWPRQRSAPRSWRPSSNTPRRICKPPARPWRTWCRPMRANAAPMPISFAPKLASCSGPRSGRLLASGDCCRRSTGRASRAKQAQRELSDAQCVHDKERVGRDSCKNPQKPT